MIYRGYPRFQWYSDIRTQRIILYEIPHEGATPEECREKVVMSREDYEDLKEWMKDNDPYGQFVTDRKEDLKIIHRLLDIQEKMVK
jgi:hypothetical protein